MLRAAARTSTQKPAFHDIAKFGGRAFIPKQLDGMIPAHATKRSTASNEDDFALIGF